MKLLFLDNRNITYKENTKIILGKIEKDKRNPLFSENLPVSSKPWEVRYDNGYSNVLFDGEDQLYKCWYTLFIRDSASVETPIALRTQKIYTELLDCNTREMGICYAFSKDGIKWQKPSLGIIEFDGSKNNNIVMRNAHGAGVFKDYSETENERRYKMLLKHGECKENSMAISFSPDGINWCTPVPWTEYNAAGDCHNNAFWNERTKKYIGFTRQWDNDIRIAVRTESNDFLNWSEPLEILRGNGPDDQIYSMPVFPYQDIYIGLPSVFRSMEAAEKADTVSCELAWSEDTINWHRVCPGEAFIGLGEGKYPNGDYDCGCIYAASAPIIKENTIWIYYSGSNGFHTAFREGSFNLATIEKDRFAGYAPIDSEKPSILRTAVVPSSCREFQVNAEIASDGWIKAGIRALDGNFLPGYEPENSYISSSDGMNINIKWQRNPPDIPDSKPVIYEFDFYKSVLYAMN